MQQKDLRAKSGEDGGQKEEPPCQDWDARIVLEVAQLANNLRENIVGRVVVVACIVLSAAETVDKPYQIQTFDFVGCLVVV